MRLDFKMWHAPQAFIDILSAERFQRYLDWAKNDRNTAVELYTLNCRCSEALYLPLHMLEITLRNRIHAVATTLNVGEANLIWFDRPEFQRGFKQKAQLVKARHDLVRNRKTADAGRVISALTFGYWTAFFGSEYEVHWQQGLHRITRPGYDKGLRRKDLSEPFFKLRKLRNRIAHYEPIIHWDLIKHHGEIIRLTGYLAPAAAEWVAMHSRFPAVHPRGRINLHED